MQLQRRLGSGRGTKEQSTVVFQRDIDKLMFFPVAWNPIAITNIKWQEKIKQHRITVSSR